MSAPLTVFEVAFEVAHKVGGIHTVVSTKARTMAERLGDAYVCVGPWRLADPRRAPVFEDEPGFSGFADSCRALGVPVRVGRWLVPGRPRTLLVDASGFYRGKDEILGRLWDAHRVDSLFGPWEYLEPLLFGHAAGIVIERWWQEFVAPHGGETVLHAHEWLSAAALLHARARLPAIGTVFTLHATVLGRALAAAGTPGAAGLAGRSPEQAAEALDVRSKHSLELAAAREADVLTTVSDLTADEAALFLGRRPEVLVNGMDLPAGPDGDPREATRGPARRARARAALERLAAAFFGACPPNACFVATAGRPEPVNKGFDVLAAALAQLDARPGPPVVVFFLVPVGVSGVRHDLARRLSGEDPASRPLAGLETHLLLDGEAPVVANVLAGAGLAPATSRRVHAIHVAAYLDPHDGLLGLSYEDVLAGMDLGVFPSAYEPWGYTPVEALAAGVPAVTTDLAGFGQFALREGLGEAEGVVVLRRAGRDAQAAATDLADLLEQASRGEGPRTPASRCRKTALRLAWPTAIGAQDRVYAAARSRAKERALGAAAAYAAGADELGNGSSGASAAATTPIEQALPAPLRPLCDVARTLRWTWDPDGPALFADLGGEAWEVCRHNPVRLLADAPASDFSEEAADPAIAARVAALARRLADDLAAGPRLPATAPPPTPALSPWPPLPPVSTMPDEPLSASRPVAYFCAEFGLHESLPVYSGGLGVLAGDHVKAAHDARLPLVAVGLFYRRGFLRQHVSVRGEQVPLPVEVRPHEQPLTLVRDAQGAPLRVELDLPGSRLVLVAWRVEVGNVPLYLLDADLPDNRPEDRTVTHRLYSGDAEARLRQELVLGKGGVRLLARLGIDPAVIHLNEGHAAFAPLERVSRLLHEAGLTFEEAAAVVRASTVFTTHTPVPAGHDRFPEPLMRRYFADCAAWVGLPWERFLSLGRAGGDPDFNMTVLGLRLSAFRNGVSRLHGAVSRRLLAPAFPGLLESEVPVTHVTNGVHLATWTDPAVAAALGVPAVGEGARSVVGADFAARAGTVDLHALWDARRAARRRLLERVRRRVETAAAARGEPPEAAARATAGLTEDALLLGFARRFATYKRADLLLRDPRRLEALLRREGRPVRLLFAGKAHPSDRAGQEVLRRIVEASRREPFLGAILFLDDYNIALARDLVRGVDVWVNTPVRGMEASGTSGMKAAANGALHLSVRDGWWDEAFDGANGFVVGAEGDARPDARDDLDAASLYRVLEEEMVPLFFDRDADGLPRRWLERVRKSLSTLPPAFDARRMLDEYTERAYRPLARAGLELSRDAFHGARDAAGRHRRLRDAFPAVRVLDRRPATLSDATGGTEVDVSAVLDLGAGAVSPDDLVVEALVGGPSGGQRVLGALAPGETGGAPLAVRRTFRGTVTVPHEGPRGLSIRVRIRAHGPQDAAGLEGLVAWG